MVDQSYGSIVFTGLLMLAVIGAPVWVIWLRDWLVDRHR